MKKRGKDELHTAFPEAYFFSVPTSIPCLEAAFSALLPLIVVSRGAPPELCFAPMRVTVSQSLILKLCVRDYSKVWYCRGHTSNHQLAKCEV